MLPEEYTVGSTYTLLWLQQDPNLVLWKEIFVDPVLTGSLTGL